MGEKKPWDEDPALDEDSLVALARRILEIRNGVAALHDPEAGDGSWGGGCRAYERTVNLLERDALSGRLGFLSVKRFGLYCSMFVNGTPVRLFRGEPENPPNSHLQAGIAEQQIKDENPQLSLFPDEVVPKSDEPEEPSWCWMMAVQSDANLRGLAVTFFMADDSHGSPRFPYTVTAGVFQNVMPLARPGVDLGPPPVDNHKPEAITEQSDADAKR